MSSVYSPEEFAEWLTSAYEGSRYKSWRSVAFEIGTSHSTLTRLAGAKPQTLTGKPSQPSADLVITLANFFKKDVNEALRKGGHAPLDDEDDEDSLYAGIENLTPEMQAIARKQIREISRGVIDSLMAADSARKP